MTLLEQYMADYQRVCIEKNELQARIAELERKLEIERMFSSQLIAKIEAVDDGIDDVRGMLFQVFERRVLEEK